jgi:Zn-dependent protease with chaperone function
MFNNIIYFIIVLLIFYIDIDYPTHPPETSLSYTVGMVFLGWLGFLAYCRWGFQHLLGGVKEDEMRDGHLAAEYQGLIFRASVLAIVLFAVDVHIFSLKPWIRLIPGFEHVPALQGVLGIALFLFYLCTIWSVSHSSYEAIFPSSIPKKSFVLSHLRLNIPILFPWLLLTISFDLLSFTPLGGPESLLNSPFGQLVSFAFFLTALMVFLPELIRYWWGCRPFAPSERIKELKTFLREKGLKYRDILSWPIFEGRMLTAGIMGIVPRYRYILIADSLMGILSLEELKAVVAHEIGHAKYRHMLYYIVLILGYMILSFGLYDLFVYFFSALPFFIEWIQRAEAGWPTLFQLGTSLPILISIFVYFRYVIGFFMRNFERQADLHSAQLMDSPRPVISSLEKIALLSGRSRALPSWHHFSVKERVDYLWQYLGEPGLAKRHNRFVRMSFVLYLVCVIGLGFVLNFSPLKQEFRYALMSRIEEQMLEKAPDNIVLHENLAMAYHDIGRLEKAIEAYERVIALDPLRAVALNNLAWILVTAPDEDLRDRKHALMLAKEAVKLDRSPVFLDTLAEAYYENGLVPEAIDVIKEAISIATDNRDYYEGQLEKFLNGEDAT